MKRWFVILSLAFCSIAVLPSLADAKRLGGGASSGMKRELPPTRTPDATPAKPAQNNAAPAAAPGNAAAAAAAPKRSWLGPIAGLAAGLGLAALMSHMGLGAEFANFIMLALMAVAAFVAVRWLMRRFQHQAAGSGNRAAANPQGLQFAGAGGTGGTGGTSGGAGPSSSSAPNWAAQPAVTEPVASPALAAGAPHIPADFDRAAFERIAKMIFIRLQAANDATDLNDLRAFTTPEMFASLRMDLQERGATAQQTDVVQIDAEVIDFASESERQVVSVRFHGLIREIKDGAANDFDEVWHLVKPTDGSREWAIAGIQQIA